MDTKNKIEAQKMLTTTAELLVATFGAKVAAAMLRTAAKIVAPEKTDEKTGAK